MRIDFTRFAGLLSLVLVGCGNSPGDKAGTTNDYAQFVAERFDKDCRLANALNAKAMKDLDQFCSCMNAKLLANVREGDSSDAVNAKIEDGQKACLKEVYPEG